MGFWAEADNTGYQNVKPGKPVVTYRTPDYEKNRKAVSDLYAARSRAVGPAAVVASKAGYVAPSGVGMGMMSTAAGKLDAASAGKGPSVAGAVAGQGVDDALRARLAAMAGRGPGANAALAGSAAGATAAGAMQQAAMQSAMAKSREVQDASAQYAGLGGSMRAADLAAAQGANTVGLANAGLAQSASLANQSTAMQWEAMSDAERNQILAMGMDLDSAEARNRTDYYRQAWGLDARRAEISFRDRLLQDQRYGQLVAGAGNAVGPMAQAYAANQGTGWDSYSRDLTKP